MGLVPVGWTDEQVTSDDARGEGSCQKSSWPKKYIGPGLHFEFQRTKRDTYWVRLGIPISSYSDVRDDCSYHAKHSKL